MEQVQVASEGKVKRHITRGLDVDSRKELRGEEDARSTAGMRNPALLQKHWPKLWSTMSEVRAVLEAALDSHEELRGLTRLCGQSKVTPPSAEVLGIIRETVLTKLKGDPSTAEDHHPASPWRYQLVGAVVDKQVIPT